MRIDIITIFPEYFAPLTSRSSVRRPRAARSRSACTTCGHWTHDVHHTVDDSPFGGGPGMVMKPEPWGEALDAVAAAGSRIRCW